MNMLEHRLRDRLEAIEHTTDIISTLSSMKNIVDIVNVDETEAGSESHTSDVSNLPMLFTFFRYVEFLI